MERIGKEKEKSHVLKEKEPSCVVGGEKRKADIGY